MTIVNSIVKPMASETIERVLIGGDLAKLTPQERLSYYNAVCQSLNLNPLTRPFEYLNLSGKLILYARKDATDQLRNRDTISIAITAREQIGDVFMVTAKATLPTGRSDESVGAVNVTKLAGDNLANAVMKAETKAKRRVTLSVCGLGMLDETEIETIPGAQPKREQTPLNGDTLTKAAQAIRPRPAEPEIDGEPRELSSGDIPFGS